jgi:hypothetical protein
MINQKSIARVFIAIFALSLCIILDANSQVIPNGSFENWAQQTVGTQTVLSADNWVGSYTQGSTPLSSIQTVDHIDGNYGIEIETTQWPIVGKSGGIVACTFPLSSKPLFINGYYKSFRVDTTGTGQVLIRLNNNGTLIGTGLYTTNTNVSNYTPFSQAITYTSNLMPDEATIWLCSEGIFGVNTKNFGNKLWIDNLSLTNEPLSIDNNLENTNIFLLYPNPANESINIRLIKNNIGSIILKNTLGQNLIYKKLHSANSIINLEKLACGIYFVELEVAGKIFATKIVKE